MHKIKVEDSSLHGKDRPRKSFLHTGLALAGSAACLLAFSGCGWTPSESKQGKELEKILLEKHSFDITVSGDLPIRFDSPEVERQTNVTTVSYRAAVIWHRTDTAERLRQRLRQLAVEHKRNLGSAEATEVAFLIEYQDQQGQARGSDTIWIAVNDATGKVLLPQMGKDGSPFRVTAKPVMLRTVEKRSIAVNSTAKAFVHLEKIESDHRREMSLNTPDEPSVLVVSQLPWRLAGTPDEVRARLQEQLLLKRPELRDREVKAVSLSLEYRDAQGKVCGTEKVDISLESKEGTLALQQVGMGHPTTTVSASLSGVTVRERELRVSLE